MTPRLAKLYSNFRIVCSSGAQHYDGCEVVVALWPVEVDVLMDAHDLAGDGAGFDAGSEDVGEEPGTAVEADPATNVDGRRRDLMLDRLAARDRHGVGSCPDAAQGAAHAGGNVAVAEAAGESNQTLRQAYRDRNARFAGIEAMASLRAAVAAALVAARRLGEQGGPLDHLDAGGAGVGLRSVGRQRVERRDCDLGMFPPLVFLSDEARLPVVPPHQTIDVADLFDFSRVQFPQVQAVACDDQDTPRRTGDVVVASLAGNGLLGGFDPVGWRLHDLRLATAFVEQ